MALSSPTVSDDLQTTSRETAAFLQQKLEGRIGVATRLLIAFGAVMNCLGSCRPEGESPKFTALRGALAVILAFLLNLPYLYWWRSIHRDRGSMLASLEEVDDLSSAPQDEQLKTLRKLLVLVGRLQILSRTSKATYVAILFLCSASFVLLGMWTHGVALSLRWALFSCAYLIALAGVYAWHACEWANFRRQASGESPEMANLSAAP